MEENKNAYSEVIEVLKLIDDEEKLEKLPMEMLELLKSKTNPEYKPKISLEIPLEEQNLQKETYAILSWIAEKYWGEEQAREEFSDIRDVVEHQQECKVEENIYEKVNEDESLKTEKEGTTLPVLYKDLKWYEKIKIKIIEIFNRLLRNKKIKEERGRA